MAREEDQGLMNYPESQDEFLEPYKSNYNLIEQYIEKSSPKGIQEPINIIRIEPIDINHGVDCYESCFTDKNGNKISKCKIKSKFTRTYYDIKMSSSAGKSTCKTKLIIEGNKKECRQENNEKGVFRPNFYDINAKYSTDITRRLEMAIIDLSFRHSFRLIEKELGPTYKTISKVFDGAIEYLTKESNLPDGLPAALYITEIRYGDRKRKKALCIFDLNGLRLLEMIDVSQKDFSIETIRNELDLVARYKQTGSSNPQKILFAIEANRYREQTNNYSILFGENNIDLVPFFKSWLQSFHSEVIHLVFSQLQFWERDSAVGFLYSAKGLGDDLSEVPNIIRGWNEYQPEYRFVLEFIELFLDASCCDDANIIKEELDELYKYINQDNPYDYAGKKAKRSYTNAYSLESFTKHLVDDYKEMLSFYKRFCREYTEKDAENIKKINETVDKITNSNTNCSFNLIRTKLLFYNEYIILKHDQTDPQIASFKDLTLTEFRTLTLCFIEPSYYDDFLNRRSVYTENVYIPLECYNHMLDTGMLDMKTETSVVVCSANARVDEYNYLRSILSDCSDNDAIEISGGYFNTCTFGGPCLERHTEAVAYLTKAADRYKKNKQTF